MGLYVGHKRSERQGCRLCSIWTTVLSASIQIISIGNFIFFIQNVCSPSLLNTNNIASFSARLSFTDNPFVLCSSVAAGSAIRTRPLTLALSCGWPLLGERTALLVVRCCCWCSG